ncbi:uncharacterized protein MYCGRDRAFT_110145 [Zymoseptoria tritici IPO323]|uniref:FAD-binding PCMH-type domain-containing protein n=1 Tax=Zymoseptoria tritici (strain CBS 115943 / IPO323) TaxID=336722 RepID=F9XFE3_ZYMTI|nr:uncharacterized protein MYCGRDRAFT_110145 [Zymoseptoria tritici IPO323]EGP86177.1 hypothetical protein MYCGRDRAFT_110145 [Zymoseptoria tritici IPO323]
MHLLRLGATIGGLALVSAEPGNPFKHLGSDLLHAVEKKFNTSSLDACTELLKLKKESSKSDVVFLPFTTDNAHYLLSSSHASACVYTPHTAQDLAGAIKIIAKHRTPFAVECSGHASNPGFSSTAGIHISMHGFQDVTVSGDNSYVDIGGGISWADVFEKLDSSTVNVLGGRVPGPGIGGFLTGGGGYSWLTNQYGLTGDTLISASIVLPDGTITEASETSSSDLFWAIKGGGNQFGVIYNFRLKAFPRPPQIYGGLKFFAGPPSQEVLDAIADFSNNVKDPKASIIPTVNWVLGVPFTTVLAYYDGIPEGDPFSMFNATSNYKKQSFNEFIKSQSISRLAGNQRGAFNTASLQKITPNVLAQVKNQSEFWSRKAPAHAGTFLSIDVEPFEPYSQYAKDAAWRHEKNELPLYLFFGWQNPLEDDFWRAALLESCEMIANAARQEGQQIDDMLLYPNYALNEIPSERLFGAENLARLRELKGKWDPNNVMGLTKYFSFE